MFGSRNESVLSKLLHDKNTAINIKPKEIVFIVTPFLSTRRSAEAHAAEPCAAAPRNQMGTAAICIKGAVQIIVLPLEIHLAGILCAIVFRTPKRYYRTIEKRVLPDYFDGIIEGSLSLLGNLIFIVPEQVTDME